MLGTTHAYEFPADARLDDWMDGRRLGGGICTHILIFLVVVANFALLWNKTMPQVFAFRELNFATALRLMIMFVILCALWAITFNGVSRLMY